MSANLLNDSEKLVIAKRLILEMAGSNLDRWDKIVGSADSYVHNPSDGFNYRVKVVGGRDVDRYVENEMSYSSVETFFVIYTDMLEDTIFSVNEFIPDDYSYKSKVSIDSLKIIDYESNIEAIMFV